jgi:hypothetical protein
MLGVTPIIQHHLEANYHMNSVSASFYASIFGGMVAALPSHPFDIAKTCMQGINHSCSYTVF